MQLQADFPAAVQLPMNFIQHGGRHACCQGRQLVPSFAQSLGLPIVLSVFTPTTSPTFPLFLLASSPSPDLMLGTLYLPATDAVTVHFHDEGTLDYPRYFDFC
jgi:hypothetical protein